MGRKSLISLLAILILSIVTPALAADDLPEELKNAISTYPGAKVIYTMNMKNSTMATMEVTDRPESVLDFYKKELTEKGWDIGSESDQKNQQSLFARKGTAALVMDTSEDNNGKTLVNLTLTGE